ncbi:MAG: hypothetical protein ACRD5K_17220 [Candidatus Acidiferrales bacterium]
MWTNALAFLSEIVAHWLALVTGPVVTLALIFIDKKLKREIKWKHFVALFLIGVPVAMFLAWQDEHTSAGWRGDQILRLTAQIQDRDSQIRLLKLELATKETPITVQAAPDPEVEEILRRQDEELRTLRSEIPSPRKRALQLSHDILGFLADRLKVEPNNTAFENAPTRQEAVKALHDSEEQDDRWMRETESEYELHFGARVVSFMQDMQSSGLNVDGLQPCQFPMGNTFAIEECGARIGALAEKLRQ